MAKPEDKASSKVRASRELGSLDCRTSRCFAQTFALLCAILMFVGHQRRKTLSNMASPGSAAGSDVELKTNGPLVRFVGQRRIPDSVLHKLAFVFSAHLQIYNMVAARLSRGSWQNVGYAAFSWWERLSDRSVSVEIPKLNNALRVVLLSDTHNCHGKYGTLKSGDILIHTGDCTNQGALKQLKVFADWFEAQPFDTKILVPGNHDMLLDAAYYQQYYKDW